MAAHFDGPETRVVGSKNADLSVPSIRISVSEGPDRGLVLDVNRGTVRIGSSQGNALCLTDPTVSRVHLELTLGRQAIQIRDLGSTNGTFVEGVRVRDADVQPGAVVRVGNTSLRVEARPEPVRIELSPHQSLGGIVGGSVAMRQIYAVIERVAATDSTVLIEGETGTGKELVARAIHDFSPRASQLFLAVDCGAIPDTLGESELFGHVKGAFTGATTDRKGVFEEAEGGTLFLDEVGELSIPLQRKLLRVLESRELRRVGSNTPIRTNARVVAATNRSLPRSVNEGLFREDLYYRLAVVSIEVPPLRARREDIPMIAQHLYERFAGADRKLPPSLLPSLMARGWPGNVRELRNYVEQLVSLGLVPTGAASPIEFEPGPLSPEIEALVPLDIPFKEAREAWTDRFESVYVRALLNKTNGNVTRAAEFGGVSRRFLQRLMARTGIRDDDPSD